MNRFAYLVLALLVSTAGAATTDDCGSDPDNLIAGANCSFDAAVTGWQAAPGDSPAGHEAAQGQPRAGALRAEGGPNGSITISGPCVEVRPGAYEIATRIKTASGTPYYCGVDIYQYADGSCGQETGPVVSAGLPPREDWQRAAATGMTDGDARSLQVRLACSGGPGFVVLFDNVTLARR